MTFRSRLAEMGSELRLALRLAVRHRAGSVIVVLTLAIGIGAPPSALRHGVLRQGLALVAWGVLLAAPLALIATRVVRAMLYETPPLDPAALVGAPLVLLVVAALASWVAARRATRVQPMEGLRAE